MKRILCLCLVLSLCVTMLLCAATQAGAALAPMRVGDADGDWEITVLDATRIQRWLAELKVAYPRDSEELFRALADADGDGLVTILDATAIQRHVAELPSKFTGDDIYDYYIGDFAHHSSAEISSLAPWDYGFEESEVAYVGVPVTFTVEVCWGDQPVLFTLSVDGETVQEVEANGAYRNSFDYLFTEAGTYVVETRADCRYGNSTSHKRSVTVIPLPEDGDPIIMGATFFGASDMVSGDGVLTVTAVGGTSPYAYRYVIYDGFWEEPIAGLPPATKDEASPDEATPDETTPDEEMPDEEPFPGILLLDTGYLPDAAVDLLSLLNVEHDGWGFDITVAVVVRDAQGRTSAPVTVHYQDYVLVG